MHPPTSSLCEECLSPGILVHCNLCRLRFHRDCVNPHSNFFLCNRCIIYSDIRREQLTRVSIPHSPATHKHQSHCNNNSAPNYSNNEEDDPLPLSKRGPKKRKRLELTLFPLESIHQVLRRNKDKTFAAIPPADKEAIISEFSIKQHDSYYRKKKIRVGHSFQSDIPSLKLPHPFTTNIPQQYKILTCLEVWDPSKLPVSVVEAYLTRGRLYWQNGVSNVHALPTLNLEHKFEEMALKILHLCNYSVKKALFCLLTQSQLFIHGTQLYNQ